MNDMLIGRIGADAITWRTVQRLLVRVFETWGWWRP